MTFAETLAAVVVGGLLTGGLTLLGVWFTARKAADAAAAADARHDAAEQLRWTRDQKLAAYSAFIAETDAWPDGDQVTDAVLALVKQIAASYTHVKLLASVEVDAAASAYFNRQMELMGALKQSPGDRAVLVASARSLRDAYVALLHAMRREIGVESS
jgi:hypothetical protein